MRGVNGKNISQITLSEARKIKEEMDARGFGVSCIASPIAKIHLGDDFAAHTVLFRHLLDVAGILETTNMRVFSFFMDSGADPDQHRTEVVDRMTKLAEIAADHGIILLHENEKEIFGDVARRCLTLVREVNRSNFRLCFDPANFVQCKENTLAAFDMLKDHIVYHHIKDFDPTSGKVVPAGKGEGKIPEILRMITSGGYQGVLALEPHLGDFVGLADHENIDEVVGLEKSDGALFAVASDALKEILGDQNISYA